MSSGTATLNGHLSEDQGYSASCYFEYGLTIAYGSDTSASPSTCGKGDAFSYTLTGLTPGETYHYRAVAVSVLGTVYGSDVSFTVPYAPAIVWTRTPVVAGNAVTLVGLLVYNGGIACTVGFEYGGSTLYGSSITHPSTKTTAEEFSIFLGGLTIESIYHFRAFATNPYGTVYGDDGAFYIPRSSDSFGGMMDSSLLHLMEAR